MGSKKSSPSPATSRNLLKETFIGPVKTVFMVPVLSFNSVMQECQSEKKKKTGQERGGNNVCEEKMKRVMSV